MTDGSRQRWYVRAVHLWNWWMARNKGLLPVIFSETAPLDLRIVGRMLLHAAAVGAAAGVVGVLFFGALEWLQRFLLEDLAGYTPLRAHGEAFAAADHPHTAAFRPWLLWILPAAGGLLCGLVIRRVPEVRGGGGDTTIEAFHHKGGVIRRRVIWAKTLASLFTLGSGGSGGREGPTMLIGGALGSFIGRVLNVSARERRILLVAGVAAGIAAVFRTPLGAALLAVEVLYRDGFESDALVPAVLSSVVAYSIVITFFGESILFATAARYPFVPQHLPLFAALALLVALFAAVFVSAIRRVRRFFERSRIPVWLQPAIGGLMLGSLAVPLIILLGRRGALGGQGMGILGGGYGAVQMAISGQPWLPAGWEAVQLLTLLGLTKIIASSFTIGSGGSAGDFAPSLAVGGLMGGAFGRAAQLLLQDPRIDPGAFALVGMAAFYGGIAHTPLSALVLACEMARNYDLLVPLMLSLAISFVALRNRSLYDSQVPTQRDSPVHRDALLLDVFRALRVRDVMHPDRPYVAFQLSTKAGEMIRHVEEATWQGVFPVLDAERRVVGIVAATAVRIVALQGEAGAWALAADVMQPSTRIRRDDDLRTATEALVASGLRELPVVDEHDRVIGFLDEADVARVYLKAANTAATDAA